MNITIEDTAPCRKTVNVVVPVEDIQSEYQEALKVYTKAAKIPGFRPGRAPKQLVEARYRKDMLEDMKDTLIRTGYHQALKDNELDVVTLLDVKAEDVDLNAEYSFSVTLDVPPKFDLPTYEGLTFEGENTEVSDEDVDKAISELQERFGSHEDIEGRAAKAGDLVLIDFEGTCDGQPLLELDEKLVGLATGKDVWLSMDENAFLPEFADALTGCNVGDSKEVKVKFAKDFAQESLQGKKVVYQVNVRGLRERKPAELDEEFCKRLGVESPEELKTRMREEMENHAEQQETARLREEVARTLLESTTMDLPESEVQEATRNAVYDMVRRQSSMGTDEDQLKEHKDEIYKAASAGAESNVKLRYILHAIAEKEDLKVTEAEVVTQLQGMAMQYRMSVEQVRKELAKRNALDNLREDLRLRKAHDLVLEKAVVTPKTA